VDVTGQAVSDAAHSRNLVSLLDWRSEGAKPRRHTALLNVKVKGDRAVCLLDLDLVGLVPPIPS